MDFLLRHAASHFLHPFLRPGDGDLPLAMATRARTLHALHAMRARWGSLLVHRGAAACRHSSSDAGRPASSTCGWRSSLVAGHSGCQRPPAVSGALPGVPHAQQGAQPRSSTHFGPEPAVTGHFWASPHMALRLRAQLLPQGGEWLAGGHLHRWALGCSRRRSPRACSSSCGRWPRARAARTACRAGPRSCPTTSRLTPVCCWCCRWSGRRVCL